VTPAAPSTAAAAAAGGALEPWLLPALESVRLEGAHGAPASTDAAGDDAIAALGVCAVSRLVALGTARSEVRVVGGGGVERRCAVDLERATRGMSLGLAARVPVALVAFIPAPPPSDDASSAGGGTSWNGPLVVVAFTNSALQARGCSPPPRLPSGRRHDSSGQPV